VNKQFTPKDHSTAGKARLGVITHASDEMHKEHIGGRRDYFSPARHSRSKQAASRRLIELLQRKRPKLAAVALANKIARIAWKLMASGETYRRYKKLFYAEANKAEVLTEAKSLSVNHGSRGSFVALTQDERLDLEGKGKNLSNSLPDPAAPAFPTTKCTRQTPTRMLPP
jgi:hypothetical protein